MRKSGARLTLTGAMGKPAPFDVEPETNSASLAQAEREIKHLRQENHKLKRDLADVRSLYNQLVKENSHERYDERRVVLLKSQVIQLERQVLLLNEALSSRGAVLLEVENALKWLADKCRAYITMDVRGPQVNVERSDLTLMVETTESARIKLYKQLENRTTEHLMRPLKFYNDFVHPSKENDVSLLDVASGKLEHLNLKQVSKLEGKLSTLYKELISLHSLMDEDSGSPCHIWTSGHVTQAVRERLVTQILKSCAIMKDCTDDLLELSLLFPSAPWPPLKTSALKKITSDYVLRCLPSPPTKAKQGETTKCIHALVRAYNYKVFMLNSEIDCLKGEVRYHRKVYNLQLKYTESLFQVVREGYADFERMGNDVIVKPLQDILEAYIKLNQSASEESLKKFISVFKVHATQLSDIVETLEIKPFEESEGSKVLSQYGDEFFAALEKLVKQQQAKRDLEAIKTNDIKIEQEKLDSELREILDEQEQRLQQKLMASSVSEVYDNNTSHLEESHSKNMSAREDLTLQNDGSTPVSVRNESPSLSNRSRTDNLDISNSSRADNSDISNRSRADNPDISNRSRVDKSNSSRTRKSTNRPLHSKEWVDVIEVEKSFESLDIDKDTSAEVNDNELLALETQKNKETDSYLKQTNPSTTTEEIKPEHNASSKPKIKKKLNYTPNTFVPNRTLNLRRSGSLTRINRETPDTPTSHNTDNEVTMESVKDQQSAKTRTRHSYQRDNSGSKLPVKKPAFR